MFLFGHNLRTVHVYRTYCASYRNTRDHVSTHQQENPSPFDQLVKCRPKYQIQYSDLRVCLAGTCRFSLEAYQADVDQIRSLLSAVQCMTDSVVFAEQQGWISLKMTVSSIPKLFIGPYKPAESPGPLCSCSTAWITSQCQKTASPG